MYQASCKLTERCYLFLGRLVLSVTVFLVKY